MQGNDTRVEYKKTFSDELDWKLLDQLHQAVSQISGFCFQTKQFCVTTEIAVVGLLVKFTADKLDQSIFVTGAIIPLCFWFLDSVAYFYQVKLRGIMSNIQDGLRSRNHNKSTATTITPVIEQNRIDISPWEKTFKAFFNHSMWMYLLLIVIDVVLWWLYTSGSV